MPQVRNSDDQIEFTERVSSGWRIFFFLVGLFPFLAPYELLVRPNWQEVSFFMIIPIIISLGAIAVGGAFMLAGMLGLNQSLRFEAASRTVVYVYETALTSVREKRYKFGEVAHIEINVHDWESRPSTYGLQVTFTDGRKVEVGSFAKKDDAEQYLGRIEKLIG